MSKNKKTTAGETTPAVNSKETTPVVETPVVETPTVETPAVETPVVETPVVETPVVETPAVETPVVETPVVETPAVETPVVDASEDLEPHFVHGGKAYTLPYHVKQLQINGIVHSRQEILTDDEIMTTLIVGNSSFVKKL